MVVVHQVAHHLHSRPGGTLEEALTQVREGVAVHCVDLADVALPTQRQPSDGQVFGGGRRAAGRRAVWGCWVVSLRTVLGAQWKHAKRSLGPACHHPAARSLVVVRENIVVSGRT